MITIKHSDRNQTIYENIDFSKSLLIIGSDANYYKPNEIIYIENQETVESLYGESELTDAYKTARSLGVQYIFLLNLKNKEDLIDCLEIMKHYDFGYIVPLNVKLSDSFYDLKTNKYIYYMSYLLEELGDYSNSIIIATDSHAMGYENIDHFLYDKEYGMSFKINEFKKASQNILFRLGRNLCFVANNLKDYQFANVPLASAFILTDLPDYPELDFGQAIFEIDENDIIPQELCYFKNNYLTVTTIENLKNFRIENDAVKLITIDRVIRRIESDLDYSSYNGRTFSEYLKIQLSSMVSNYLESIVNVLIRDYSLNNIEFVITNPGEGIIYIDFSILPINSFEDTQIVMEV